MWRRPDPEQELARAQQTLDDLLQSAESLDFSNLGELVGFFEKLIEPTNAYGVTIHGEYVVAVFEEHGFGVLANTGPGEYRPYDPGSIARWTIGQGLHCLQQNRPIYVQYRVHAERWRGWHSLTEGN